MPLQIGVHGGREWGGVYLLGKLSQSVNKTLIWCVLEPIVLVIKQV